MARRYMIIFGTPKPVRKGECFSDDTVIILSRDSIKDDFIAVEWFEGVLENKDIQAHLKRLKSAKGFLAEVIDERSL